MRARCPGTSSGKEFIMAMRASLTALSSFPAGENEDAEHTNENVLDVRVIIHDDSHYAHPRKERGCLADDMPPVQKQLPGRIKPPIINLHGSSTQGKAG
jgi:hypothetical protein